MLQEQFDRNVDTCADRMRRKGEGEARRAHDFWRQVQRFDAGAPVRRQGRLATATKIAVLSGWACEMKLLPDGRRQIFAFLLPHEVATFTIAEDARRDIVALTRLEVIDWGVGARGLNSAVASSWEATEAHRRNRMFDQIVRLGRLTAEERMLNLFLELFHRLQNAGLVQADTLKLPLTQELLADALGLSVVHINRTMQKLKAKGYITLRRGAITLHKPDQLARLACFEPPPAPATAPAPMPMVQPFLEEPISWRPREVSVFPEVRWAD